jgi:hypothetical protein
MLTANDCLDFEQQTYGEAEVGNDDSEFQRLRCQAGRRRHQAWMQDPWTTLIHVRHTETGTSRRT